VHGSGGPRAGGGSRVHGGPRAAVAERLAERGLGATPVSGSSLTVGENEEETSEVPTMGEDGRCDAGGRPATVR
jgi:hypothetical protein